MIGEINQSNLYLLLPSKVSWMAEMLMDEQGVSLPDAIRYIYSSDTYKKLENEESKSWHLGPATLYYDLKQERKNAQQTMSSENVTHKKN